MKLFNPIRIVAGVLLAAASAVFVFACTTPTKVAIKGKALGVEMGVEIDSMGNPVTTFTGALPAGVCIKVEYRGSSGELLGTATVHVPGSCQIPSGATSQSFSLVECPPDEGATSPTGGAVHARQPVAYSPWVEISGMPILPNLDDGGIYKNAVYHFRVKDAPGVDPFARIEPILRGGPGTPVPPGVEVLSFTQFIPESLGARMIVADTAAFDQFRLDWNGQVGYADLATGTNVLQHGAGNHWQVIESFIPTQDFNIFVGESNHGVTVRKTVSEPVSESLDISATVLEF